MLSSPLPPLFHPIFPCPFCLILSSPLPPFASRYLFLFHLLIDHRPSAFGLQGTVSLLPFLFDLIIAFASFSNKVVTASLPLLDLIVALALFSNKFVVSTGSYVCNIIIAITTDCSYLRIFLFALHHSDRHLYDSFFLSFYLLSLVSFASFKQNFVTITILKCLMLSTVIPCGIGIPIDQLALDF